MSRKFKHLQVLFMLGNILTNNFCKAESKCDIEISFGDRICTFEYVLTNDTKLLFYPTDDISPEIETISFSNSEITTLTSELCEAFSNVRNLNLQVLSMKNIKDGALHHCKSLTRIDLI